MKGLQNPEHPDTQSEESFPFKPHPGKKPEPIGDKACFERQTFLWGNENIEYLACGAARDLCWGDKWTGNDVGSNTWWRSGKWEYKKRCTDRGWKESDKVKCWPDDTIFITWSNGGDSTRAVTSLGKTCMYDQQGWDKVGSE